MLKERPGYKSELMLKEYTQGSERQISDKEQGPFFVLFLQLMMSARLTFDFTFYRILEIRNEWSNATG